jgi:hypothetical protein
LRLCVRAVLCAACVCCCSVTTSCGNEFLVQMCEGLGQA